MGKTANQAGANPHFRTQAAKPLLLESAGALRTGVWDAVLEGTSGLPSALLCFCGGRQSLGRPLGIDGDFAIRDISFSATTWVPTDNCPRVKI